ncbi:MAG: DUF3465 domain-containing protein [Steroidobacteraceae bacterium]
MRRLVILLILAAVGYPLLLRQQGSAPGNIATGTGQSAAVSGAATTNSAAPDTARSTDATPLADAIRAHSSYVYVQGSGTVAKSLPDDTSGSRHQRFLVRVAGGGSVLIAHNIDLAPRVQDLQAGTSIEFAGEYIWNEKGGLVHWTHHDPSGRHRAGWIEYQGQRYQ